MKIALGADHAGYRLKDVIIPFIESLGHEVDRLWLQLCRFGRLS